MLIEVKKKYSCPIALTQQFKFCGNPFRVDMYRGCDFGCSYCFANARHVVENSQNNRWSNADPESVRRRIVKARTTDFKDQKGVLECIRHMVPMHCGGMSDPFQAREWELGLTKRLIEISNEFEYPIIFSTKTAYLPDEYFKILNPKIHAFQISLIGSDDDFVRNFEHSTPSASERIAFIKKLKNLGFWVSCRIQPLIDVEQAKKIIVELNDTVDYFTVEHLKIPIDNKKIRELFEAYLQKDRYAMITGFGRSLELNKEQKVKNIEYLKQFAKKPIGCGDNDIHYLSDSRCCCGVDLIGGSFSNWMRYNSTYFCTGEVSEDELTHLWKPSGSVLSVFMQGARSSYKCTEYQDFVDIYCERYKDFIFDGGINPVSK